MTSLGLAVRNPDVQRSSTSKSRTSPCLLHKVEKMPFVYFYTRLIHGELIDGDTTTGQMQEARSHFDESLESRGFTWGGDFVDLSDTRRQPLHERPEGGAMCCRLRDGDHVLISSLDRGFLDTQDFVRCCQAWVSRGISLSVIDLRLFDVDEHHLPALKVFGNMAAADAARRGERAREARVTRESRGRASGGNAGLGFRFVGPKARSGACPIRRSDEQWT